MTAVVDTEFPIPAGVRAGAFGNATHLICRACGAKSPLGPYYACMECFGPLEVGYAHPKITREQIEAGPKSIWRYQPLLPVPADIATFRSTDPGYTRLLDARHLADELGLAQLWVKDDSGNPTHSFKDRVVAVALSAARELGLQVLACPSTGNLANAVAAAAARAGIKSVVFIPQDLEPQKITASAIYDTTLIAIEGNYDDVNKLASEIAGEEEGWAFVNVNVRPYYAEGSKTLAFEIAEQLGWRLPDQIVVPVASGSQLTKIDKGIGELIKLGLVEEKRSRSSAPRPPGARRSPRPSGAVTTWSLRSSPARSRSRWRSATPPTARTSWTRCGVPGASVADVGDDVVVENIRRLARTEGVFAETAGGVTIGPRRS